jgi:diaminohydroxyphosphoribosylaminopyrimidine deaminase/5-amino-6-(5-phosphoribosylamino)uracil reductase
MPEFSAADSAMMARAMRLAAQAEYTAHPNPMVGCVLVNNGAIVGEGWHEVAGAAHAEINALREAGDAARGSTAYVTLEPCVHHGKTPPCVDALVAAGVSEVVVALEDPFPAVSGGGLAALTGAGVIVRKGLMRDSVAEQLKGFVSRNTRGRPYVRMKVAASIDGCIAMADGESQWITGPAARADVQRLRARSGAIMTGIGTVLADDPSLTVRDLALDMRGRQPLRVVLDRDLRLPASAKMLAQPGETLVYCGPDAQGDALAAAGADVINVRTQAGELSLPVVISDLATRGVNDLLVEAGPTLAGALLEARLVDELVIYQAPHIMGSQTLRMFATPTWTTLASRQGLHITDRRSVGNDLRITATFTDRD